MEVEGQRRRPSTIRIVIRPKGKVFLIGCGGRIRRGIFPVREISPRPSYY